MSNVKGPPPPLYQNIGSSQPASQPGYGLKLPNPPTEVAVKFKCNPLNRTRSGYVTYERVNGVKGEKLSPGKLTLLSVPDSFRDKGHLYTTLKSLLTHFTTTFHSSSPNSCSWNSGNVPMFPIPSSLVHTIQFKAKATFRIMIVKGTKGLRYAWCRDRWTKGRLNEPRSFGARGFRLRVGRRTWSIGPQS